MQQHWIHACPEAFETCLERQMRLTAQLEMARKFILSKRPFDWIHTGDSDREREAIDEILAQIDTTQEGEVE